MNATAPLLSSLKRDQPEWAPWLHVVEAALSESEQSVWAESVPNAPPSSSGAPRLAGTTLFLHKAVVERYLEGLLDTAAKCGTEEMMTLGELRATSLDAFTVFHSALCQHTTGIEMMAIARGAHPDAFQAVAALLPVPFLQACNHAWGRRHEWVEPYCPICGSWPSLAEVRGIERSRHYRCGRCGSEWLAPGLCCPFCATTDHRDLVRLVPGVPGASSAVEACRRCLGYVKTFNRLQGAAPSTVLLEDLRSVALDMAAIEQGYSRPATAGYAVDVTIAEGAAISLRDRR